MASIAVVIMAKQPVPGAVKTRLRPLLPDRDIAALYDGFLRDRIDQVRLLRGAVPVIAYTPAESRPFFADLAPDFRLLPQAGGDLSARLTCVFQQLLETGPRRGHRHRQRFAHPAHGTPASTLLTGSRFARYVDVVLGPSDDGGYYLIGLRQLHPALFDAMPWSTPQVYDETLRRAAKLGLRVASLPGWYDVDTPAEFERLRARDRRIGRCGAPAYPAVLRWGMTMARRPHKNYENKAVTPA